MWDSVVLLFPVIIAAAAASLAYRKRRREKAAVALGAVVAFAAAYATVLFVVYSGAALLSGAIAVFIALSALFYLDDNTLFYPLVTMGFAYLGLMALLFGISASAPSFAAATERIISKAGLSKLIARAALK